MAISALLLYFLDALLVVCNQQLVHLDRRKAITFLASFALKLGRQAQERMAHGYGLEMAKTRALGASRRPLWLSAGC